MAETVVMPTTAVSDFTWTVSEVEEWAPRFRFEIIEGVLYMSPVPVWPHPHIVSELITAPLDQISATDQSGSAPISI